MKRKRLKRPLSGHAFSLLELLVGVLVLSLLVVFLSQMLSYTSRAWIQSTAGIERLQNLRVVTDFVRNELQSAMLPTDRTATNSLQFVVNPPGLSAGNRDTIFWQSPVASDTSLGDAAEVGYFVRWDNSVPGNPRSQLCRFFLEPSDTARGVRAGDSSAFIYQNPDNWVRDALLQEIAPADKASLYRGLFAENVVGMWITCLDANGQQIQKDFSGASLTTTDSFSFDSRQGFTDSKGNRSAGWMSSNGTLVPQAALPAAIDVGFVMLDSSSANKVNPAVQDAIISLVKTSPDAASFVISAQSNTALQAVRSGFRHYQTRVQLVNSK